MIWRAPAVGVLTWIWISLMQPQQEVYGFMNQGGVNFIVAAFTILSYAVSNERKTPPINAVTAPLLFFTAWACLTTFTALDPGISTPLLDRTVKTVVLCLAVAALATTRVRIQALVWVLVLSIGYYAVKGAGFFIIHGGAHKVFGPDNTMIGDNNALGLALVMLLPLINYLRTTSERKLVRTGCVALMALTLIAIIGTYSRGALLSLGLMVFVFALRSRAGIVLLALGLGGVAFLPRFLPPQWLERMASIGDYSKDASFEGRVAAWRTSFNIATERPIGGGFSSVEVDWVTQAFHSPGSSTAGRAAHSIYFQVLGDHGFLGLAIYLLILAGAVVNTVSVLGHTRNRPDLAWARRLALMMQVSIAGFLVGGAALSMAYYDGFLILLTLTGALLAVVRQPTTQLAGDPLTPVWRRDDPAPRLRALIGRRA